jgi:REP element-mobilizing transposase RayT
MVVQIFLPPFPPCFAWWFKRAKSAILVLMSRNYKFQNPEGWYFVSFATVFWLSVFTRRVYKDCVVKHLKFCIEEKRMILGAWIIMSNHVHLIFSAKENNLQRLLQSFKSATAKELIAQIKIYPQESRRERYLWLMKLAAKRNNNKKRDAVLAAAQ